MTPELEKITLQISEQMSQANEVVTTVINSAYADYTNAENEINDQVNMISLEVDSFLNLFETETNALEQSILTAQQTFEQKFEQLRTSIDSILDENDQIFSETESRLDEVNTITQEGIAAVASGNEKLNADMSEIQSTLDDSFDNAVSFINEVSEALNTRSNDLDAFVDECNQQIQAIIQRSGAEFENEIFNPLDELAIEIEDLIVKQQDYLDQHIIQASIEKIENEIMEPIRTEIQNAMDQLQTYILNFVTNVVEGSAESINTNKEMELAIEDIKPVLKPIEDAIEHVKKLAGSVGIG